MSFSALNWAWDQNPKSGIAKFVLVYLANCANNQAGETCWPSVADIVRKVKHGDAAVRRALKELADDGYILVESREASSGRTMSNRYHLLLTEPTGGLPKSREARPTKLDAIAAAPPPNSRDSYSPPRIEETPLPNSGENPLRDTEREKKVTSLRSVARAKPTASRLPDDWKPTDADLAYALAHNVDPARAVEEFRNYWLAQGDVKAARKADWSRTFHNRVLDLADRGRFRLSGARPTGGAFSRPEKNRDPREVLGLPPRPPREGLFAGMTIDAEAVT